MLLCITHSHRSIIPRISFASLSKIVTKYLPHTSRLRTQVHRSPKYSPIRLNEDNNSSISPKRSDMLKPSPVYAKARTTYDDALSPPKPRRRSVSAPAVPEHAQFTLGEPVLVTTRFGNYIGAVRFCGRPVDFADGEWIGVEFDEPVGKNNGSVQGVEYFRCRHNHGLFVRPNQIRPYFETSMTSKRIAKTPPKVTVKDCRRLGQDLLETHRAHIDNVLEALKIEMEELARFEEQINQCDESGRPLTEVSFGSYMTSIEKRLESRRRLHVLLREKLSQSKRKMSLM